MGAAVTDVVMARARATDTAVVMVRVPAMARVLAMVLAPAMAIAGIDLHRKTAPRGALDLGIPSRIARLGTR